MAGYIPHEMRGGDKFCYNCFVFDWKQPHMDTLKRCKECRLVWYCDEMCQKEHWHNTHKKQCKYLSKKKVLRNAMHEETTCRVCKEEAGVGREEMSKESNPILPCIMSRANKELMNIDGSFLGMLCVPMAEMTGIFHTKLERLLVTFMRILVKMKMTKHSLWQGSRTAVLASDLYKKLWHGRIDHLWRVFSFKKPGPLDGQLAFESLATFKDIGELMQAIEKIRIAAALRGIIPDEEFPSLFKPMETIKVLTALLCTGVSYLQMSMIAADCVGVSGIPEEIMRFRTTFVQFNKMRDNVLNLLSGKLIPYCCLVVDGICDKNPVQQCTVCREEIIIRKVAAANISICIYNDPVIVLYESVTYALCGRETCCDRLWKAEGPFDAGRKKLNEQYFALAGDHIKELCDYCGKLNHKAKGLRCGGCLTKLYCGVECQVKDTYHLQSKCERGDKRKKKRSDPSRKKEGYKELSGGVSESGDI